MWPIAFKTMYGCLIECNYPRKQDQRKLQKYVIISYDIKVLPAKQSDFF